MAYLRGTPAAEPVRVVVTGMGVVTSLGRGCGAQAGFRHAADGLRPLTAFDASRQRTQLAGQADLQPLPAGHGLSPRQVARLDRATQLLLGAGLEAYAQAGWAASTEPVPLCFGTSAAAMPLGERYYQEKTSTPRQQRGLAHLALNYQPASQVRLLADALRVTGPMQVIANACASGSNAIGHAFHLIRSGRAHRAIAGGYDGLSQLVFAGFDSLQALSTTRPRPFAADRDGLALGEGAAVLLLERRQDALARGATILGEIAGYGAATDLHHLTQPHPQGDAALCSMTAACAEAGWTPSQVDYINAHGTGTPLNDGSEGAAICRWAGEAVSAIRVSSTKGSIGHLLGGAGAVEAALCLLALRGGWVPPNVPVPNPDPVCHFQLIQKPLDAPLRRVLSNSFGFGGANATLALQHPDLAHS
ncbi:MAG: beta-ketoacyl-[acyl-carrier-protein] synthase family protein [Verrucomicrobiales bacterium]|nr:beta-ketoacyl-[acyl-carrier-protein] synthase family protein [Verrucomicrobiales bacterium]